MKNSDILSSPLKREKDIALFKYENSDTGFNHIEEKINMDDEISSHSMLLMGIKDELLKAEHFLSEKNAKFEKVMIENMKLKKEREEFIAEIASLKEQNELFRRELSNRKK